MKARALSLFLLLIGLVFVFWSFWAVLKQPAPAKYQNFHPASASMPTLLVGTTTLQVEIADTDKKREQGLSGRDPLPANYGMLFVFQEPGTYGFWMKDMKFSLDMVWIGADWTVISVEKGATPESYPQIFEPDRPVKYVLEIPAGEAERLGIDAGEKLYLNP